MKRVTLAAAAEQRLRLLGCTSAQAELHATRLRTWRTRPKIDHSLALDGRTKEGREAREEMRRERPGRPRKLRK